MLVTVGFEAVDSAPACAQAFYTEVSKGKQSWLHLHACCREVGTK